MKGITLCAECAYYNMKKHKCTRGCKIDPDVSKGENPSFYVDCPLPDVEPVQKWIPCSEKLPVLYDPVMILTDDGSYAITHVTGNEDEYLWFGDGGHYSKNYVLFWMPLPEPPKE